MLWSKPFILSKTIPRYETLKDLSLWQRYGKRPPYTAYYGLTQATIDPSIEISEDTSAIVCWQHLLLHSFLKDMHSGWHLCLLPDNMIAVIHDGQYVTERQTNAPDKIESTKKYLYRYGFEPETSIEIHDLQHITKPTSVPLDYDGFVFYLPHPWHGHGLAILRTIFKLIRPYINVILVSTILTLGLSSLSYGVSLHKYIRTDRLSIIKNWPNIQENKKIVQRMLTLISVFEEAKVAHTSFENIHLDHQGWRVVLRAEPEIASANIKKFLKRYYRYPVQVQKNSQTTISIRHDKR